MPRSFLHLQDVLAERVLLAPVLDTLLTLDRTVPSVDEVHANEGGKHTWTEGQLRSERHL